MGYLKDTSRPSDAGAEKGTGGGDDGINNTMDGLKADIASQPKPRRCFHLKLPIGVKLSSRIHLEIDEALKLQFPVPTIASQGDTLQLTEDVSGAWHTTLLRGSFDAPSVSDVAPTG